MNITLIIPTINEDYTYDGNQLDNNYEVKIMYDKDRLGPGAMRQRGLDLVTTPYVAFMDDDDTLSPNFMLIGNRAIKDNPGTELIIGGIERAYITGEVQYPLKNDMTWLHGKIYSVDFLRKNNIRFPEGIKYNEDVYFNTLVTEKVNTDKILKVDCCMYYYNAKEYSMTHSTVKDKTLREICINDTIIVYGRILEVSNNNDVLLKKLYGLYEIYNEAKILDLDIDFDSLINIKNEYLNKVKFTPSFLSDVSQYIGLTEFNNYNKTMFKVVLDFESWTKL